jgi:hypothetical protein
MPQKGVGQHAGDHRFADRHGADADTRVVAAFGDDLGLLESAGDRATRREN